MKFKFTTDRFNERRLEMTDVDGDTLRVHIFRKNSHVSVNYEAARLTRKQLRKFAKAILKETAR